MEKDTRPPNQSVIAVITGDIINSRANADTALWQITLKKALGSLGQSPRDWQIYRGDSFQLRIDNPDNAIKKAIWLKSVIKSIKGLDLRMAIGIGGITYDSGKVTESNGDAFIHSGSLFDSLKKRTLALKTPWPELDEQINLYLQLALLTMDGWSKTSAQIVAASMEMPNAKQVEIAKALSIPQSRVSERQVRAGYETIMKMERYCYKLIQNSSKVMNN